MICARCGKDYPESERVKSSSYCRECRNEYAREYRLRVIANERWLDRMLEETACPCDDCQHKQKRKGCMCEKFKGWFCREWADIQQAARRKKCGY